MATRVDVPEAEAMGSWSALPAARLEPAGPSSAGFRRIGCGTFQDAARYLHELPYARNTDRSDFRLVLVERRGTCSTKHALLADVALEQKLPVALAVGIYDMTDANTPGVGRVLAVHGLDALPEAHCYLKYAGRRVDVTRSGVAPQQAIARFHREWEIGPAQIGEHKVELHQAYLREWLRDPRRSPLSFEDLWRVREECILALASPFVPDQAPGR